MSFTGATFPGLGLWFALIVPIMLATGIAVALSKCLSYGSIYTTKLLRRGIDIERPRETNTLQLLTVADVMQPFDRLDGRVRLGPSAAADRAASAADEELHGLLGPSTDTRRPQALFADEDPEGALRQLVHYGRDGLPVLSHDGEQLLGWVTRNSVLSALAERLTASSDEIERGALAAEFAVDDPSEEVHQPSTPLRGYQRLGLTVGAGLTAVGRRQAEITWPDGSIPDAITEGREILAARNDLEQPAGERPILLVPALRERLGPTVPPR